MSTFYRESFFFEDGFYFYLDGRGGCSVITHENARKKENDDLHYNLYMHMSVGGEDEDIFERNGFKYNDKGKMELSHYIVDEMAGDSTIQSITDKWDMPEKCSKGEVNMIYDKAFAGTLALREIHIPESVMSIGSEAFSECCNLKKINIPDKVKRIGEDAFYRTAYHKDKNNWKDKVLYLDHWLIAAKENIKGEYVVQEGTVGIADGAFCNCSQLTKVKMPESVKYIGMEAFAGCTSLEEVWLPKQIVGFDRNVFWRCPSLVHIELPYGVKSIDGFKDDTSLKSVTIPETVTEICDGAFRGCSNLDEIILPDSITIIGLDAFANTGYANNRANWTDNVLYLGQWLLRAEDAFDGCCKVKEGTVGIADGAFRAGREYDYDMKSLKQVVLPESIRYIGSRAFANCKELTRINIPSKVTTLRYYLFEDCSKLETITIPKNVESIRDRIFYGCEHLKRVIIENPNTKFEDEIFDLLSKTVIYGPSHSEVEKYARKQGYLFKRRD